MDKPVEFSEVYKTINAIKGGDLTKQSHLEKILSDFKNGDKADSFLHEIGQRFLIIGIDELLKKANCNEIASFEKLTNKEWTEVAQTMITYSRKNQLPKKLSSKWDIPRRQIDKHITNMARYVTEGLIDSLEESID